MSGQGNLEGTYVQVDDAERQTSPGSACTDRDRLVRQARELTEPRGAYMKWHVNITRGIISLHDGQVNRNHARSRSDSSGRGMRCRTRSEEEPTPFRRRAIRPAKRATVSNARGAVT